jgi:hypothetical protein
MRIAQTRLEPGFSKFASAANPTQLPNLGIKVRQPAKAQRGTRMRCPWLDHAPIACKGPGTTYGPSPDTTAGAVRQCGRVDRSARLTCVKANLM